MPILDTHIHAPQYPNMGVFGKSTLLHWLNKYTFPLEASLSSAAKAEKIYSRCVARTLSHGTTTAAYFATIHVPATNLLASICHAKGQRAFIGRVCMDSDFNPQNYRDASPTSAIEDTRATINHIASIDPSHELLSPIITPRFAPSCSSSLLASLGALAVETKSPIQTHISENPSEIELVAKFFPKYSSYAEVYDAHGLLTPRSVLAHAVHLTQNERNLIRQRGAAVSHCPVSNSAISSGICPVRELLHENIEVGLGTDVSGGWSPSVLVAAREAGMVSRILAAISRDSGGRMGGLKNHDVRRTPKQADEPLQSEKKEKTSWEDHCERKKLSVEECLYLATVGGAKCLGLEKKVGRFEVGMQWDAQLVQLEDLRNEPAETFDTTTDQGPVEIWEKETWRDRIAKWLFCGDDRNTRKVYVKGRLVHERLERLES